MHRRYSAKQPVIYSLEIKSVPLFKSHGTNQRRSRLNIFISYQIHLGRIETVPETEISWKIEYVHSSQYSVFKIIIYDLTITLDILTYINIFRNIKQNRERTYSTKKSIFMSKITDRFINAKLVRRLREYSDFALTLAQILKPPPCCLWKGLKIS